MPRDGIPLLNPDWSVRTAAKEAGPEDEFPEDWLVILGMRSGARSLVQHEELLKLLDTLFPKGQGGGF